MSSSQRTRSAPLPGLMGLGLLYKRPQPGSSTEPHSPHSVPTTPGAGSRQSRDPRGCGWRPGEGPMQVGPQEAINRGRLSSSPLRVAAGFQRQKQGLKPTVAQKVICGLRRQPEGTCCPKSLQGAQRTGKGPHSHRCPFAQTRLVEGRRLSRCTQKLQAPSIQAPAPGDPRAHYCSKLSIPSRLGPLPARALWPTRPQLPPPQAWPPRGLWDALP